MRKLEGKFLLVVGIAIALVLTGIALENSTLILVGAIPGLIVSIYCLIKEVRSK